MESLVQLHIFYVFREPRLSATPSTLLDNPHRTVDVDLGEEFGYVRSCVF